MESNDFARRGVLVEDVVRSKIKLLDHGKASKTCRRRVRDRISQEAARLSLCDGGAMDFEERKTQNGHIYTGWYNIEDELKRESRRGRSRTKRGHAGGNGSSPAPGNEVCHPMMNAPDVNLTSDSSRASSAIRPHCCRLVHHFYYPPTTSVFVIPFAHRETRRFSQPRDILNDAIIIL